MPYCKYCSDYVSESATTHYCKKKGILEIEDDGSSFLVSAVVGAATDSALIGGLLGGDMIGGVIGDLLDGDLFD